MYERAEYKNKKIDLREFEANERVCLRKKDGTIKLGTYVGNNRMTAKLGDVSIVLTVHTVREDGERYEPSVDGAPFRAQEIGKYTSTKKGGRTRRIRRRKATRRR